MAYSSDGIAFETIRNAFNFNTLNRNRVVLDALNIYPELANKIWTVEINSNEARSNPRTLPDNNFPQRRHTNLLNEILYFSKDSDEDAIMVSKLLTDYSVNPNPEFENGSTLEHPLSLAARRGLINCFAELQAKGSKLCAQDYVPVLTALVTSEANENHIYILSNLLLQRINLNVVYKNRTPLDFVNEIIEERRRTAEHAANDMGNQEDKQSIYDQVVNETGHLTIRNLLVDFGAKSTIKSSHQKFTGRMPAGTIPENN